MSSGASDWDPVFPEEEVPFILAAVLRSGARLKKRHPTELENDLNDRLRDELDRDPELRSRPTELFREVPLYDRKRARQKPLGRTDLLFLYSTGARKPWPYFVIEAKRLHVNFPSGWQSLISEYVTGHQGMMCFIDQRYSRDLRCGGMLGYVFDGQVDKARESVGSLISVNHPTLKCAGSAPWVPSLILAGERRISESRHALPRGAFVIYHLFMPV